MYRKAEDNLRMTEDEASERYPDEYILMKRDNRNMLHTMGTVLYIGDDYYELSALNHSFGDSLGVESGVSLGIVIEGLNHMRSLGGIVVGE
jgi:hypothetical protein